VKTRSHWHWGFVEDFPDEAARDALAARAAFMMPALAARKPEELPSIARISLHNARIGIPRALAHCATTDTAIRVMHASGKGYRDVVRAFRGEFPYAPDVVVTPEREEDIAAAFELCGETGAAFVPFGGGTSVVSGVTYDGARPIVSVDLANLRRVIDVDETSRLVRIEAGATGPDLEAQLASHDLSLRFYPQSFELSTLGGWIATRAGGHFATGPTHIDDLVASVRMVSPSSAFETKTFPASGAGPDPNRVVIGSEGALGVITAATLRAFRRPVHRARTTVFFDDVARAIEAAREIAQAGLFPSNCRVIDRHEALFTGVSADKSALLLAFESHDHEVDESMDRALHIAVRAGGAPDPVRREHRKKKLRGEASAAETYRAAFLRGPYWQSALVPYGAMVDTFETACTWSRFDELDRQVRAALAPHDAMVAMRFSHVYADGPAPYYTFGVACERGEEIERHEIIKRDVSDAIERAGATITHHHAVGRLHRPWYERERPASFGDVLRAVKRVLDPQSIMNPGVLLEET
jgi:alkyldihydroxyacetonephosphate synthase